jgi:hypothetical protein
MNHITAFLYEAVFIARTISWTSWLVYRSAEISKSGQEEIKSRKKIALFCDLNYIYSGIDLKQ